MSVLIDKISFKSARKVQIIILKNSDSELLRRIENNQLYLRKLWKIN